MWWAHCCCLWGFQGEEGQEKPLGFQGQKEQEQEEDDKGGVVAEVGRW